MRKVAALLVGLAVALGCAPRPEAPGREMVDAEAGGWATWVVASAAAVEVGPPPGAAETAGERDELARLAASRDQAALDEVAYWATADPGYRWMELALEAAERHGNWDDGARTTSNVAVAVADAVVTAWHWKRVYGRARPAGVGVVGPVPESPAYPCEHAAAAGAASAVLAALYPDEAPRAAELAERAARSRLLAGAAHPSDAAAGLELGRRVGALVAERAAGDNSDARWRGTVPDGEGLWRGERPDLPAMGTWRTWLLASGAELRPAPPPPFGPEAVAEVRWLERTSAMTAAAYRWAGAPAVEIWHRRAARLVLEHRLDRSPPRAARVWALLHAAFHDATIAAWDAKYAYWGARPDKVDPGYEPLARTPNFPGYPSAHATQSGAAAAVLAHLFPRDRGGVEAEAEEAAASRLWLGIHFRVDNEVGLALGRRVAERAVARARSDGA